MGVSDEAGETLSVSTDAEEDFDEQDALQGEAVGAFGSAVLPEIHVQNRILGSEKKSAVASF